MNSSWSGPGEESLSSPPASPPPEAQKLPENPPFSVVEVLRIGVLMFVVPMFLAPFFVILVHWFFYPRLSLTAVASKPWILLGSQLAWYGVIAWFLIDYAKSRFQQSLWKAVRWNWPRQAWPALVAIGLATLLVLQELERVLPPAKNKPFDQFFDRPMDAYAFAFLAIAFAPFMEELFFRGLLYPVLARRLGVGVGVLLTAFAFALIHVLEYKDWVPVLIIFLVGVVLTAVRATMKSVGASFIVHSIYNGIPIIYALIASRGFRDLHKLAQ